MRELPPAPLSCSGEGAPPGSAQLRELLAQPVLCLLGLPLLDQLAMLQHAPAKMTWTVEYEPGFIPPLNRSDIDDVVICQRGSHWLGCVRACLREVEGWWGDGIRAKSLSAWRRSTGIDLFTPNL